MTGPNVKLSESRSERRILVIEPHHDDAVLSAGGQLLQRRGIDRLEILTIFERSMHTGDWDVGRPTFDVDGTTRRRVEESRDVALHLGAEWRGLGMMEASLRFRPAADWASTPFDKTYDAMKVWWRIRS